MSLAVGNGSFAVGELTVSSTGALGTLGSLVPTTGTHGGGYGSTSVLDVNKEYRFPITTAPTATGTVTIVSFFAYEDSSFDLVVSGGDGTVDWQFSVIEDGVTIATAQAAQVVIGAVSEQGTGLLMSQDATIIGAGHRIVKGTGVLTSQSASMTGAGEIKAKLEATGLLTSQVATMSGAGRIVRVGSGTLVSSSATVIAAGQIVRVGTGALVSQPATIDGAGAIAGNDIGAGVLVSQPAIMSGAGSVVRVGNGALQGQSATMTGVGKRIIIGSGILTSQSAAISGVGVVPAIKTGTGALQAQSAVMSGTGLESSITTLTTADLQNVTDSIFARLIEGCMSFEQAQRIQLSSAAGDLSGVDTGTIEIKDACKTKVRITATVDGLGNRTTTLDGD